MKMLSKSIKLRCGRCCQEYDFEFRPKCTHCGGLLDPVYEQLSGPDFTKTNPLERYFHLVPLQYPPSVSLNEGNTPCIHAVNLGRELGLDELYLKDETKNPTNTTKDRIASCVLSQLKEFGIEEFVASSTGNSSTSFAFGVQKTENMVVHLFCGAEFVTRHAYCRHPRVHLHVVDGDFVAAGNAAKKFADEHELPFEGGFFNCARREALKLAYLEAFDVLPNEPTYIVQAVSSGMGMYGAYRGICEYKALGLLKSTPKLICAQQESCAPMQRAFVDDSPFIRPQHIFNNPSGIAQAILRGDPSQAYPYIYDIVKKTGGSIIAADRASIVRAREMIGDYEGIDVCYASATALAATFDLARSGRIKKTDTVLVNLTGAERSRPDGIEAQSNYLVDISQPSSYRVSAAPSH